MPPVRWLLKYEKLSKALDNLIKQNTDNLFKQSEHKAQQFPHIFNSFPTSAVVKVQLIGLVALLLSNFNVQLAKLINSVLFTPAATELIYFSINKVV